MNKGDLSNWKKILNLALLVIILNTTKLSQRNAVIDPYLVFHSPNMCNLTLPPQLHKNYYEA